MADTTGSTTVGRSLKWRRWLHVLRPLNVLSHIVNEGSTFCTLPTDHRSTSVNVDRTDHSSYDYSLRITNDAFEVMVSSDETLTMLDGSQQSSSHTWVLLRREVFVHFAIWYLWQRAWGEWFGLKRKLFYWWLTQHIKSQRGGKR